MSSILGFLGFLGFLVCIPIMLIIINIWWEATKSIIDDVKELFKIWRSR